MPLNTWLNGKVNGKLNGAFRIPPRVYISLSFVCAKITLRAIKNIHQSCPALVDRTLDSRTGSQQFKSAHHCSLVLRQGTLSSMLNPSNRTSSHWLPACLLHGQWDKDKSTFRFNLRKIIKRWSQTSVNVVKAPVIVRRTLDVVLKSTTPIVSLIQSFTNWSCTVQYATQYHNGRNCQSPAGIVQQLTEQLQRYMYTKPLSIFGSSFLDQHSCLWPWTVWILSRKHLIGVLVDLMNWQCANST